MKNLIILLAVTISYGLNAQEPARGKVTGPKSYESPSTTTSKTSKKTSTTKATTSTTNTTTTKSTAKTETPKANKKTTDTTPKPASNPSSWAKSYIGVRGGYNLNKLSKITEIIEASLGNLKEVYQPGYMGGIYASFGLGSGVVSVQPELNYMQTGFKVTSGADYSKGTITKIDLPILLKAAFGKGNTKIFLNAGPYIGYKLKQEGIVNFGGIVFETNEDLRTDYDLEGIKDNLLDFGAVAGAGILFKIGKPVLSLEGRYQYGLADPELYKNGIPKTLAGTGHTRSITGTLAIQFPLGN
jgi:hypothetical protein